MVALLFALGCADTDLPAVDDTGPVAAATPPVGGAEPAPADDTTWEGGVKALVASRCAPCHGGGAPAGSLDLASDPLTAMLGVTASQAPMALVEPGDHLYSYLWHKVNGTQSVAGGSGTNMPVGAWLDDADVERLARWIDRGCP